MKKVLKIIGVIALIIVATMCLFLTLMNSSERLAKNYVKDTYGFDVVVNQRIKSSGAIGEIGFNSFLVSPKNDKDFEFEVIIYHKERNSILLPSKPDKNNIHDNYKLFKKAEEELHKLDEYSKELNELGFEFKGEAVINSIDTMDVPHYIETVFYSTTELNVLEFENDLERLYKLNNLVKQSGAELEGYSIEDKKDVSYFVNKNALNDATNEEEFLALMKKSNWEIASTYVNEKWASELEDIENERFHFKTEHDKFSFNCVDSNALGECSNILVSVYFEENLLTQENASLEEDLNTIFNFFENVITPKVQVEYRLIDKVTDALYTVDSHDINKYETTKELIQSIIK